MKNIVTSLIFVILISTSFAQQNEVLFTIDDTPVYTEEFERVYTKNNINNQADYSKASLEEYLNLFVNFKLKVAEAEALQLDTVPSIKKELASYQKQLVENYATDKEVSKALLQEAYDRSKSEVDASHILVRWPNDYPSAKDSAQVLRTIEQLKSKLNADNFASVAFKNSEDPSAKDNKGRLGYLTVFQTVYPFENALYATKKGEISEPVATQFGYHLVLVHDVREARGKIKTAHLLIKSKATDTPEKQQANKDLAFKVYQAVIDGEYDFESAVKQYSQDSKTKYQGGKLPELNASEMITEFADAAFSISKDREIAPPVLTSIGWHIIQRISKSDVPSFDEASMGLSAKIARDSRSNVEQAKNIADSKSQFGYQLNKPALNKVLSGLEEGFAKGKFSIDTEKYTASLFSIGQNEYTQKDFIDYTIVVFKSSNKTENLSAKLKGTFTKFQNEQIQNYRELHLADINEDYKNLLQEYHDGILLFELTDKEVWSKAVMDTAGLRKFHAQNEDNYQWKERLAYATYTFENEAVAKKGIKFIEKGKPNTWVLSKLNKKETLVKMQKIKEEKEKLSLSELAWEKGANFQETGTEGQVRYSIVESILPPEAKKLDETRGYVISDYQNFLEKEWIASLKEKYQVKVNQDIFNSLIK